ncbi:hypothetical protein BJX62DRAFT_209761 [Aspergillus germanicus]
MNVNVLRDNPKWYWYLPFAAVSLLITFLAYIAYQFFEQHKNVIGKFRSLLDRTKKSPAKGAANV